MEDGDGDGCGVCVEEVGVDVLWVWRVEWKGGLGVV